MQLPTKDLENMAMNGLPAAGAFAEIQRKTGKTVPSNPVPIPKVLGQQYSMLSGGGGGAAPAPTWRNAVLSERRNEMTDLEPR